MRRNRPPFVAQGTWWSGALHVWGWNGLDTAPSSWLYGGFGRNRWTGADDDWSDTPVTYGTLERIDLDVRGDDGVRPVERRIVPAVRLEPGGAAIWLADPPADASASVRWFARLIDLAVGLVGTGHVTPTVGSEGTVPVARWSPHLPGELAEHLTVLARAAPPICRVAPTAPEGVPAEHVLGALVDGIARAQLLHTGWRPDLGRRRHPEVRAARAVFTALATLDPTVRPGRDETGDVAAAVGRLGHRLERHARRLRGEPVVRARVRLDVPTDPHDPWQVTLEVVDDADDQRWCTAAEVWAEAEPARRLAGGSERLAPLAEVVRSTAGALGERIAVLAPLAAAEHPTSLELDVAAADELLDVAPAELERLGVDLIGPERLVRATVGVRGRATPAPSDHRPGRLGADALVSWDATVDDAELPDAELERLAASGATLLHTGHRWVRIDPAAIRRTRNVLSEHRTEHAVVGPAALIGLAAEHGDALTTDPDDDRSHTEATWVASLLAGLPDERLEEAHEPAGFRGELRHYQRRGLAWMRFLARLGLGGCLADDMGLGKTATTLAHLVDRPGPHLVVCPVSVVHNWEAEALRFTPGLQVAVHHGSGRGLVIDGSLAPPELVITTYGLVTRDPELAEVDWSTVVLDEAQAVKNPATKAARAVRRLRAEQKLALTGTPVENRLAELWSILDAVNPGLLGGQQRFRERYGIPIERHGDAEAAERLRRLTRPFVLRRTKADRRLLPDLPDKIEQVAFASLTREQAVLYQQVVDQLLADADELQGMERRGRVLTALMRLKQVCNHPAHALADGSRLAGRSGKLARFDELVDELLDVGERALVFSQFRAMGELLQRHLHERLGLAVPFLHGGVARARRTTMVDGFQRGEGPPLLLVSLKAGGTGLNLTAASQVIHYDRWWNPAVEDQATDRAWRIGQDRTVNVHKLVCQGTVEERIGRVIDDKRALADAVVGSGEAWLSELSTDELRDLVVLERDAPSLGDRRRSAS